jgi:hypothetical protein
VTTRKTTHRGAPEQNASAVEITEEQLMAFQRKQEEQKRLRIEGCNQEIAALLEKYNCTLQGEPRFTQDGRVGVIIQLVSK